jgi:hypothetical protein
MSESVYFLTLCLPLATILIVFGMRYRALVLQARAQATGNSANAAALDKIAVALADVQARLAGIEKILKAVE